MKKIFMAAMFLMMFSCLAYAGIEEAGSLFKEGKLEEAMAEYKKALPEASGRQAANLLMNIGTAFYRQGKYAEAEDAFRTVLNVEGLPDRSISTAQFLIGHSLYSRKKYEEAIGEYRKLDALKGGVLSQLADAQRHIGHCYRLLGKNEEAVAEYRKAVTMEGIHPRHASNAQFLIGLLTKNEDELLKVFDIEAASPGDLRQALRYMKNKERLVKGYLFQLKTSPDREEIIKLGEGETLLAREAVSQMPGDTEVVSALLPGALEGEIPAKEKASILAGIWQANIGKISAEPEAKKLVDDVISRLTGIIGQVSSPEEAEEKIKEMK